MIRHRVPARRQLFAVAFLCATGCSVAHAELSATDVAKLGRSLTPLGAEIAGNAAGTIPAWDGVALKPPAGFTPGGHYPDPYASDAPLYTITGANADTYAEKLTPGQLALLKKYPDYKLIVYPTRRSATFPKAHYAETREAAAVAKLAPGGNGVMNVTGGVPFPIPKDGQEAIWNHLLRYRGDTFTSTTREIPVLRNGDYSAARVTYEYDFSYGNLSKSPAQREPNRILDFLQIFSAPPRLAGGMLLVHEPVDQVKEPRTSWLYSTGQRRVRLAPEVSYDNPAASADGLRTLDEYYMFNGALDRYDWKLVGKKEIYIPYNSYKVSGNTVKSAELIRPGHLNNDYARYELHRVWIVEANLKPGVRHLYAKRVFYLDEDSWAATLVDTYDSRNQLWRFSEAHSINLYDKPFYFQTVQLYHDLLSGRYLAMGLGNDEPAIYQSISRTPFDFTPAHLRDLGIR